MEFIKQKPLEGFWVHFDTDVLGEEENPAVGYRLPGGLLFSAVEYVWGHLLGTYRIAGMSVTIFNPKLDTDGIIAGKTVRCIGTAFHRFSP